MRWSLRNTLLAILLPLTLATVSMSAARIADLITLQRDIEGLRSSAFRSIYAERYARYLQALLKESFDHVVGRRGGPEALTAARAGIADTFERLRPFVQSERGNRAFVSTLTARTLDNWEQTQAQIDLHIERAIAAGKKSDHARARRLLMDDLEVLARARIFSSIDLTIQREQELLEEYRVRVSRATESWLAKSAGASDVREHLLPAVYETILAERFLRSVYADFRAFTHHVIGGRPLAASHGVAASQTMSQLSRLQPKAAEADAELGAHPAGEPAASYELVRDAYARTLSLPPASRSSNGLAVARRLDEVFEQSLLPHTNAIIWTHEESIEREMDRVGRLVRRIVSFTTVIAMIAILIALASPYLALRLLAKPIDDLLSTLSLFREGQKDARSDVRQGNALGRLGLSLNAVLDELQKSDRKQRFLAFYDGTTGLPNRQFFEERMDGALIKARIEGRTLGLLALSIDGMREVNETLGHSAGDELARQIAARLRESLRMSDIISRPSEEESTTEVSHLGGDHFSILLTRLAEASDGAIAAKRVLAKIMEPLVVEGHEIVIRTSIGIGVCPHDGEDAATLLRNSSAAMNEARRRGGNVYQFYSDAMNVANARKLHIQSLLGGAIERDDLELHFQPIHDARYGRLAGAEALLRWVDSEMGPVAPDEFIPIAEQCGLITRIGHWVFHEACKQVRAWQDAGYAEIRMSINASANQLRDANWVKNVSESLRETGISPGCLELEITETTIMSNEPQTIATLTELSDMGLGIVLDDFGTGYSSLSHLRSLPINRVKIDRSFVSEISDSEEGSALVGGIVVLAHGLKLEVVAEGVETHEQANFLREVGCDELQGYLISGAVKASEFERLLTRSKPE